MNYKHGQGKKGQESPTWRVWRAMRQRVRRPSYDERGITICKEFLTFEGFVDIMGEKPPGMTLDRIDNDGDYTPENCRWATPTEQNRNKRNVIMLEYQGRTLCLSEWAEEWGMNYHNVLQRYHRGWTPERISTTPIRGAK